MPVLPSKRPDATILKLINAPEPMTTRVILPSRSRISWKHNGIRQLYIIKSGEVSLIRNSDGLHIVTFYEPGVLGIAEASHPTDYLSLKLENESEIMRIDADKAFSIFENQKLWHDVTNLLSFYISYLACRDDKLIQSRNYSVIRNHLIELSSLPSEYRSRVTILSYIQDRTLLSRSCILNIVAELQRGKYIDVKKGGYLSTIHHLPDNF